GMPSRLSRRSSAAIAHTIRRSLLISALCFASTAAAARADDAVAGVRLYAIDCGRILVSDMSAFADTGELDGRPATVVASCFLVRHPKGILLWDTGLSDKLAGGNEVVQGGIFHLSVRKGLVEQLRAIGVAPSDVTYLAFSHLHFDHTGNANLFASAT